MRKPTSIKATLKAARRLISKQRNWVKHDLELVDRRGNTRFCAIGALRHVDGPFEAHAQNRLFNALPIG